MPGAIKLPIQIILKKIFGLVLLSCCQSHYSIFDFIRKHEITFSKGYKSILKLFNEL